MKSLMAIFHTLMFFEMVIILPSINAEQYDYVIVGGGTAGLLLATRLSENINNKVIILEAGENPNVIMDIPLAAPMFQDSDYDWKFKSIPQTYSFSEMVDKRACLPRGKGLGGSSIINYMVYSRGSKKDYDHWADEGCTGWNWNEVLPYFKKSESNSDFRHNNSFHGTKGEMSVQMAQYYTDLANAYLSACKEMGYQECDFNGKNHKCFMKLQGIMKKGGRWNTYKAFYYTLISRQNVVIFTKARVTKILFDEKKRAYGVQYDHHLPNNTVEAKKEVLICAGAISSPQLLMLSGIGPRKDLEKLGISVISDLPVGQNFQDHVSTGVPFIIDPPYTLKQSRTTSFFNILKYFLGEGPLTSMGFEVAGYVNSKYNKESDWPDLEIMFLSYTASSDEGEKTRENLCLNKRVWNRMFLPYTKNETISCIPVVMKPKSRGSITLASNNPYDNPLIDPNYLAEEEDLKILVEGMKICYDIANTKTMKSSIIGYKKMPLNTRPFPSSMPSCGKITDIDEYFACWARVFTLPLHHACCTCKMGSSSDPSTVVDPQLRVKGVTSLRVVDASIMPYLNTGHTEAPTLMIAEKAADMILHSSHNNCELCK